MEKFLKRTLNPQTMVYEFPDGTGKITMEQKENILLKSMNANTGKHNLFVALVEKEKISNSNI